MVKSHITLSLFCLLADDPQVAARRRLLQGILAQPQRDPLPPGVPPAVPPRQVRRAGRLRVRARLRGTGLLQM